MRVTEIALFHILVPLRRKVRHASAERETSDNLIVRTSLQSGVVGYGEGVPRPYVTGETIDGAFDQLLHTDFAAQLTSIHSFEEAVRLATGLELWQPRSDPRGCYGNAARCAVELSLLDAYARQFGQPLRAATPLVPDAAPIHQPVESVRYSGAITAASRKREFLAAIVARVFGFRDVKVKVGVNGQDDERRLRRIRRIVGRRMRIRVDANEAWRPEELAERIRELEPHQIVSVEQPVKHEQVGSLANLRGRLTVPIMHDESLCSLMDARCAIEQGTCDLFNIRLSKCGGFTNSVRIAALAHRHGLGYQLGCQVGETGLLSAAGRHFATSVAGIQFLEGSYDRHLLAEQLTNEDVTFGYGGRAPALDGPGLGVSVNTTALALATRREERIQLA
jgi:muconate cycloisomerase